MLLLSGCGLLNGLGVGWKSPTAGYADDDLVGPLPTDPGASDPQPGDQAGTTSLPEREVIVFYTEAEPYFGHPSSETVLTAESDGISAVVGFWYQVDRRSYDRLVPFGATTGSAIERVKSLAQSTGTRVVGLFHNLLYGRTQWSRDVIVDLLNDLSAQDRLIQDVIDKALSLGLSGINIDLENVDPALRHQFSPFVESLSHRLHDAGLEVSIAVPAKTWDNPNNGWSGAFDYRRLGRAVDRVMLMTYDEHGYVSGPGPIASSGWVEAVVQHAVSEIPHHKVFVGLAGYGFDWPSSGRPQYISYAQAVSKAREVGATVRWDIDSNSPTYTYVENGQRHEVWFENAASSTWKLDLVETYDLGGVALWRGGLEDPTLWRVMAQKFEAAKP